MSANRIPPLEGSARVKHRKSRGARRRIGEKRIKGTIYHYGPISSMMAISYVRALKMIKPAFRTKGWHDQLEYFIEFI